jgi:hypothetical protein
LFSKKRDIEIIMEGIKPLEQLATSNAKNVNAISDLLKVKIYRIQLNCKFEFFIFGRF